MGKIKIVILTLFAVLLASLAGTWAVQAQQFHTGDVVSVTDEKKIDGSLYATGRSLTIDAEVHGDVFCAGQTIIVTGTIHGDVICAGQTVVVKGKVDGNVRLAGQAVTLEAEVAKSATVVAQTFVLEQTGKVGEDITIGSNDTTLKGSVGRDVIAGVESLMLAGTVGRNVSSQSNNTKLTSDARVGGNFTYTSHKMFDQAGGAMVSGTVTRNDPPVDESTESTFGEMLSGWLYWLIAYSLVVLALILLFPRMFQTVTDRAIPTPWWALLAGFGAMLAMPLVLIVLAITFIGLPLMIVALILWIGILLLSGPVFGYYVGRLVFRNQAHPVPTMLGGSAIVVIASFVPYLNILVCIATIWLGSGMLVMEILRRTSSSKLKSSGPKSKKATS